MSEGPPKDIEGFLLWFQAKTEAYWDACRMPSLQEQSQTGVGSTHWRTGTKWKAGLSPAEIEAIEAKYSVAFPDDYKAFLKMLNAPDRGMLCFNFKELGNRLAQAQDAFLFPDWTGNEALVRDQLDWPVNGWISDLKHNQGWFDFMGPKPGKLEDQIALVRGLVNQAPPLIPVFGHRYMTQSGSILSVYQTDIIVYAPTLRDFLLRDFSEVVGNFPVQEMSDAAFQQTKSIPVWGELL